MDLALRGHVGKTRRRGLRANSRRPAGVGARHPGRPYLLFRHQLLPAGGVPARAMGAANFFYFAPKSPEPMKANVTGPDGIDKPVHMGSYGIGPTRLVAALIEAFHDDAGIKWPEAGAPV